jgi:RHS repeat-associated protein
MKYISENCSLTPILLYSYDPNGNITNDGLYGYNYDARNRLVSLNTGISYSLNGLGQRVAKTIPEVDPNSLAGDANNDGAVNASDYSLILDQILGTQTVSNADCNEDGQVDVGDLICVNIKSNGLGVNGKTLFVYDEQGQLIGEYDSQGNPIQETIYLGNLPVAVIKQGNVYYIHADQLNTPRLITDVANSALWTWESDPFGKTAANEDPDGDGVNFTYNLRFPGQYYDQESGLHYNYLRDYDPGTGRYVESDPIGMAGGADTYAYVLNNPLSYVDSLGLKGGNIVEIGIGVACEMGNDWLEREEKKWDAQAEEIFQNDNKRQEEQYNQAIERCQKLYCPTSHGYQKCMHNAKVIADITAEEIFNKYKNLLDANPYRVRCPLPPTLPRLKRKLFK